MPMQHPSHEFDADDRKVYRDWLRKTVVAYVAVRSISPASPLLTRASAVAL
jgi:hypothetical protein